MKTIRLHGMLGKRFGSVHHFDVKSPIEAFKALCSQVRGFRAYVHEHCADHVALFVGKQNIDDSEVSSITSKNTIRIVPVIQGASGNGKNWALIVVGALLVVAAPFTGAFAPLVGGIGWGMVAAGVGGLITPKPPGPKPELDPKEGFSFSGVVNTTRQGNPVPICYGKLIVGSQLISLGLDTR